LLKELIEGKKRGPLASITKFFAFKSRNKTKNLGLGQIEYACGETGLRKLKNIFLMIKILNNKNNQK